MNTLLKRIRKPYVVSGGLILLINAVWMLVIPPFQSPDEQAHLRYIQFIAEEKRVPVADEIKNNVFLESSPAIEALIENEQAHKIFHNRNYHYDFEDSKKSDIEGFNAAHLFNHPPFYYILGAILYTVFSSLGIKTILYVIRFSNLIFVGLNFVYGYLFARSVSKNKYLQLSLPMILCLWPMFMFVNSGINSDVSLFTSYIATFYYLLVFTQKKEVSASTHFAASLWIAIGLLSKAQYFMIAPFILGVIALRLLKNFNKKRFLLYVSPLVLPLLYFLHNILTFGHLFPNAGGPTGIVRDNIFKVVATCESMPITHYIGELVYPRYLIVYKGFIGNFGWLDTQFPKFVYVGFAVIVILSFLGLGIWLINGRKHVGTLLRKFGMLLAPVVALEIFYIFLFLDSYTKKCYTGFPTQGRYYFPLLLPVISVLIIGLKNVVPKQFRNMFLKGSVVFILFFNMFALAMLLQRYYL